MLEILKDEFAFLKSLPQTKTIRYNRGSIFQKVAIVLCFYVLLDFLISMSIGYSLDTLFPEIEEAYSLDIEIDFGGIFLIVFLLPFFEELIFRLPLKLSKLRLSIFLFLLAANTFLINFYVGFGTLLILGISLNFFFSKKYFKLIKSKWLRYKVEVFYFFTFVFGLVHVSNFDPQILPWYIFPIVFLPQLIGGFLTGIVRLRFGFFYGLLFHSVFNGIISILEYYTES